MGIVYDKQTLRNRIESDVSIDPEVYPGRLETIRYVNAYDVDRAFGGHEEGGWWYDTQEPISSVKVRNVDQAIDAVDWLDEQWRDYFDDGRDISSVLHTGSLLITVEEHYAEYQPKERPHYE